MTQVGHCLFGASLAVVTAPAATSRRQAAWRIAAFALLANVPDLPLPGWGHQRYDISHSLFVNLALIAPAAAALRRRVALRDAAAGAGAWLTHLLLDTFYANNAGLAMFWPVSDARLHLPIALFRTTEHFQAASSPGNVRVYLVELAVYLPLLALAAATWALRKRRQAA